MSQTASIFISWQGCLSLGCIMDLSLVWERGTSSAGSTALRNNIRYINESESEPCLGKQFKFVYNILSIYCISISIYWGLRSLLSLESRALTLAHVGPE